MGEYWSVYVAETIAPDRLLSAVRSVFGASHDLVLVARAHGPAHLLFALEEHQGDFVRLTGAEYEEVAPRLAERLDCRVAEIRGSNVTDELIVEAHGGGKRVASRATNTHDIRRLRAFGPDLGGAAAWGEFGVIAPSPYGATVRLDADAFDAESVDDHLTYRTAEEAVAHARRQLEAAPPDFIRHIEALYNAGHLAEAVRLARQTAEKRGEYDAAFGLLIGADASAMVPWLDGDQLTPQQRVRLLWSLRRNDEARAEAFPLDAPRAEEHLANLRRGQASKPTSDDPQRPVYALLAHAVYAERAFDRGITPDADLIPRLRDSGVPTCMRVADELEQRMASLKSDPVSLLEAQVAALPRDRKLAVRLALAKHLTDADDAVTSIEGLLPRCQDGDKGPLLTALWVRGQPIEPHPDARPLTSACTTDFAPLLTRLVHDGLHVEILADLGLALLEAESPCAAYALEDLYVECTLPDALKDSLEPPLEKLGLL